MKNLRVFTDYKTIKKINIHSLISRLSKQFGLQIIFLEVNIVSSEIVLELNKKYLKHNYNTDIITFNYSVDSSKLEGEIFISFDDAEKNSKRFRNSINEELKRLIIHGVLHLVGYNDSTKTEKRQMSKLENEYLNSFKNLSIIK
jgi:rRNA maturation RNase YbeY